MEKYANQRFVHALVRQQDCQPDEVAVLLTTKNKIDKAMKTLSDEGFESGPAAGPDESGPAAGPELELKEGQPIIARFRGNISDADGRPVG